ncbi:MULTISPECIES: sulfur oxidation c-type cytochrome SoxX [unclassified Sulfurospirillum]|uniref:sulfur oxidation c-type cytochrome SoxX n=1 Tax=unclassified Sulfurospirillum TaxID=2618290 RepID=UPI00068AFA9E|nr:MULTISPECIES: sulfur oxidation c-type cytochrome SoxX [unclassified Sulfurospirillum]
MMPIKLVIALSCTALLATGMVAADKEMSKDAKIKLGEAVYKDISRGNCLACHTLTGSGIEQEGNMGPNLANFVGLPDEYFFNKIWDPNVDTPNSTMPPLGRNLRVTKDEIDAVIAYIRYTVK